MSNPFKKNTNQYKDFETLSDLQWHCTKCELKSSQAKTWQIWRQEKGIQLDQDENGNWYKRKKCNKCANVTIHRKLKTIEILPNNLKARAGIPKQIAKRAKQLFECIDEYTLRKEPANKLEIDHRIPQVRWGKNEDKNLRLTDDQINEKFMLLTRENNLLKSRACEKCVETGLRSNGYGEIEFWYKGDKNYSDTLGCDGCFWYNPSKWREELNKIVIKK